MGCKSSKLKKRELDLDGPDQHLQRPENNDSGSKDKGQFETQHETLQENNTTEANFVTEKPDPYELFFEGRAFQSLPEVKNALADKQKQYGENHTETAKQYYELGIVQFYAKHLTQSLESLEASKKIFESAEQQDHEGILKVNVWICKVRAKQTATNLDLEVDEKKKIYADLKSQMKEVYDKTVGLTSKNSVESGLVLYELSRIFVYGDREFSIKHLPEINDVVNTFKDNKQEYLPIYIEFNTLVLSSKENNQARADQIQEMLEFYESNIEKDGDLYLPKSFEMRGFKLYEKKNLKFPIVKMYYLLFAWYKSQKNKEQALKYGKLFCDILLNDERLYTSKREFEKQVNECSREFQAQGKIDDTIIMKRKAHEYDFKMIQHKSPQFRFQRKAEHIMEIAKLYEQKGDKDKAFEESKKAFENYKKSKNIAIWNLIFSIKELCEKKNEKDKAIPFIQETIVTFGKTSGPCFCDFMRGLQAEIEGNRENSLKFYKASLASMKSSDAATMKDFCHKVIDYLKKFDGDTQLNNFVLNKEKMVRQVNLEEEQG